MTEDNLNPVKLGQAGENHPAKKPKHLHRNKTIAVRVTEDELKKVAEDAKEQKLSISRYGRKLFGLEY